MASNNPGALDLDDRVRFNLSPIAVEDEKEARAVVEDIAALNGIFSDELHQRAEGPRGDRDIKRLIASNTNLKTIASNATHRLAEDLNDDRIHFVLECIQNADDNDYEDGVEPFIRLSVSPQQIQLDCNEIGFKEEHVRALCSVGDSTKAAKKVTEGYVGCIGEKGIGFKSVFKVAERVYVHSPPFSFMFDKKRELGMITPLWVPEGEVRSTRRHDSQTAILLLPSARETYAELSQDFLSIPSTLLLFLRKLRKLELAISNLHPGAQPTSIHKTLTSEMLDSGRVVILTEEDLGASKIVKKEKYYIFEQVQKIAPTIEERRKGVAKTELALAFPVDPSGQPCDSTQPVHAFLPIRDFGFKFLIQADFITASSRQDVDQKNQWNEALRNYVHLIFKNAVVEFVNSSNHELRYTWMRFLPTGVTHPFWKPIQDSILQVMQRSTVLESRAGTIHCPFELYRLPNYAKDRSGCPVVGTDSNYLSSKYMTQDQDLLKNLNVDFCSKDWVLKQLYLLGDTVKSKPVCWHEDLAGSLLSITSTAAWSNLGSHIKQLPLIPLQDGTWVSAIQITKNPIYFRRDNGIIDVPADINLRLVDSSSSVNTNRERLFRLFGVKDCDKTEVAGLILQKHQDGGFIPRIDDAVAHVQYLFGLDPAIRDKLDLKNLWLYDEQDKPAKAQDLYVRHTKLKKYSAASIFGSDFPVRFLSTRYDSCTTINDQHTEPSLIQSWLQRSTAITDIPRLTRAGKMSQDFIFILKKFPNDVLHILKAHWATYKSSVDCTQDVKDRIATCEVQTFDGVAFKQQKLKNTFAPDHTLKQISSDLCSESRGVFFLYLESYKSSDWKFLKVFEVKFTADLVFYDWFVRQTQFRDLCTLHKFKDLLRRIASLSIIDESRKLFVWRTFRDDNVFIPNGIGGSWVGSKNCVWGGPSGFSTQHSIMQWYNDDDLVSSLLRSAIKIQDATVEAVVQELTSITPSDEYLQAVSVYFVAKLKDLSDENALKNVREAFKKHDFLPIDGKIPSRVKSTSCFWGNPRYRGPKLSFKHDLQPEYERNATMSTLCKRILGLSTPSWRDLIRELDVLKGRDAIFRDIEDIYAYMFNNFSEKKSNWKLILEIFEENALVFVQLPTGNCWKPPSKCIWQTPITLRCKFALKKQYSSSDIGVLNLLRSILNIKDAGVRDYISDLEILSTASSCNRDDVENLYRHIELQWKPEVQIRPAFVSNRLILNHKEKKWVSLDSCIWSGPNCIKLTTKLASLYPNFKRLFSEYLQIRNATSVTYTREFSGLDIPDPENITEETLVRVKSLLFGLNSLVVNNPGCKFPKDVENFLRTQRIWPRRDMGLASVALVDLEQPFFVPDHPLLLNLFQTKEICNFPILEFQCEEISSIKSLLLILGLEERSLSSSKKETVSATDMSNPADDLTEDLQKRSQALFSCAVHYNSKNLAASDLLKKLSDIRVYRTPDISTKYEVNSQGIEKSVVATGYLRMAEEHGELRVFVPDDEVLRKTGYSNCLATEMIRILQIPEDKSWQTISALLTSEPNVDQLALILSLQGIHNTLSRQRVSWQGETQESANVQSDYEVGDEVGCSVAIQLPASIEGSPRFTTPKPHFNQSLAIEENVAHEQAPERLHINLQRSAGDSVPLDTETLQILLPSSMPRLGASHDSPRSSQNDIATVKSRIIAKANAASTSIFTVAPDVRGIKVTTDPTSKFNLSDLAMALPLTPPRTVDRNKSVENIRFTESQRLPARVSPATPPSQTEVTPTASRTNPHRYEDIDIIGYKGEQYCVEVLKHHLPDFEESKHWTSKLRKYGGFGTYGNAEVTDLTYPDIQGLLSKFILDRAEDGRVPDWLKAASITGSKCPTYFLEVKTTTGALETPFIISRNQFKIMEDKAITVDGIPNEVYVILRVYDINEQPRIKIYLDPWNSREQHGGLRFMVEKYTVTQIST